ncbi:hypothetical protein ACLB1M_35005 [Escherichia coli]
MTTFLDHIPLCSKRTLLQQCRCGKLPLPTQDSRDIIAAACRQVKSCLA